jgi:peptide/nickel transport system permease protein
MPIEPRLALGLALLLALGLVCAVGPLLYDVDPRHADGTALNIPPLTEGHPLGTDSFGRDVLARILEGGQISLVVGVAVGAIALIAGVSAGLAAALGPHWLDSLLMRFIDAAMTLPFFVLVIALRSVLSPGVLTVIIAISAFSWMECARVVRAQVLALRERDFITAAIACGTPTHRLVTRHLLPNALPPVLAVAGFVVGGAILAETGLSFIGLGVPADEPSWGNILTAAQNDVLLGAWWALVFPAVAIVVAVVGVDVLARTVDRDTATPGRRLFRWMR